MNESFILKFLFKSGFLSNDEREVTTNYSELIERHINELKSILNEEHMEKVFHLVRDVVSHMYIIRDCECSKMFHLGIKLGMELEDFERNEG